MAGNTSRDSTSTKHLPLRVTSFASDPLHSSAYLSNLKSYLAGKFSRPNHVVKINLRSPSQIEHSFLYSYRISESAARELTAYKNVAEFVNSTPTPGCSEIVFATGYPSREWLNAIVDRFAVDYRFLHSHLDFLPSAQRDWYTSPIVPSRRQHYVRLLVPSIIFFETETRRLPVQDLNDARNACTTQLRQKAKNFFGGSVVQPGQSIVRQVNIHSGDMMVLEQAISITVTKEDHYVKVIVWSDASDYQHSVPFPHTPHFQRVSQTMEFCPVFFEQDLRTQEESNDVEVNHNIIPHTRQPLAVLPLRYGETMDWSQLSNDPLMILQELFHFQSSAAAQYLNMLHELTTETIARTPPTGETHPSMDDILHFEYTKTILGRWYAHFKMLIDCLDDDLLSAPTGSEAYAKRHIVKQTLKKDLLFLTNEVELLINLCESGKSTVMSSFTVFESKQAAVESKLVTRWTQATNRITFIFLPISFVTSVFGMNFKQFGQGPLSITLWLAVTLPLLGVCVFLNECWGWLVQCFRGFYSNSRKLS